MAFIVAMVSMLIFLGQTRMEGFHYLMRKLLKAVKEYRITKKVARLIVRRLLKAGIPVDPELMETLDY